MSKDPKYIEAILRERSKRRAEINKQKVERGPYSTDDLIRQAIDINARKIKEQSDIKGEKMTSREARKLAIQVAENRDKRARR